jgi:hypothetical protein
LDKLIERINDVIDVFKVTIVLGSDHSMFIKDETLGFSSHKWTITFGFTPKQQLSVFSSFIHKERNFKIIAYSLDNSVEVIVDERLIKANIEEDEVVGKLKKDFSPRGPQIPGGRIVSFYPKNNKQLQKIMQRLALYMLQLEVE